MVAFSQYPKEIDTLKALLKTNPHDTMKLHAYKTILNLVSSEGWTEDLMRYNTLMVELAEKKAGEQAKGTAMWRTYKKFAGTGFHNRGVNFANLGERHKAIEAYRKSMAINREIGYDVEVAFTQTDLSRLYANRGDYMQAIELLYGSLRIFDKYNDQEGIGDVYLDLGWIHSKKKDGQKSIYFLKKALGIYQKAGLSLRESMALQYLSIASQRNGDAKGVLKYTKMNLELMHQLGESRQAFLLEQLYWGMSMLHDEQGSVDSAIYYMKKDVQLNRESDNASLLGSRLRVLGQFYLKKKEYSSALACFSEALAIDKRSHNLDEECQVTYAMSKLYRLTGKPQLALEMQDHYILMKDSLQRQENEKRILEEQFKYEYEKRELLAKTEQEAKVTLVKQEAAEKDREKNTWLFALAMILLLLSVASFFLYKYYRQKNIIESQKSNLLKQKLLASQMNPHFIFNSLNAIQNYIFKKEAAQAGAYLLQFAEMMRMILDFSRKDYITLESEIKFLESYFQLQQLRFDNKFDFTIVISEDITARQVMVPPMLTQPFVENAIEHGMLKKEDKGKIEVVFTRGEDKLAYSIEDNGTGLNSNGQKKSTHESLALAITRERLEILFPGSGNAISIADKKEMDATTSGVKVTFAIPLKEN